MEYVVDFCFSGLRAAKYGASLFEAGFVGQDPQALGGAAKWRYRFAESGP